MDEVGIKMSGWMLFPHARKLGDHKIPGKLLKNERTMSEKYREKIKEVVVAYERRKV